MCFFLLLSTCILDSFVILVPALVSTGLHVALPKDQCCKTSNQQQSLISQFVGGGGETGLNPTQEEDTTLDIFLLGGSHRKSIVYG